MVELFRHDLQLRFHPVRRDNAGFGCRLGILSVLFAGAVAMLAVALLCKWSVAVSACVVSSPIRRSSPSPRECSPPWGNIRS
ncbi:MAG: hypothetical protein LBS00_08660 [Synergistaceae bacterium]|nr:hypothetical protein [Synergistaceae bacterium]